MVYDNEARGNNRGALVIIARKSPAEYFASLTEAPRRLFGDPVEFARCSGKGGRMFEAHEETWAQWACNIHGDFCADEERLPPWIRSSAVRVRKT